MPKVSGTITLYFENVEFEDDGQMTLRDQAIDALKMESFSDGDLVDVQIDTLEVTKSGQALVASDQAASRLDPSGFDPSRERDIRLRAIEEVVGWIEESSFREFAGILGKRKRTREDAQLRGETIREERASLISMIRARLGNESGTTIRTLREIRDGEFGRIGHYDLMDAAILAERKLITLTATISWGSGSYNSSTADAQWFAEISDKGREVLEAIAMEARQGTDPEEGLDGEAATARAERWSHLATAIWSMSRSTRSKSPKARGDA